jgi:hypothetical protein
MHRLHQRLRSWWMSWQNDYVWKSHLCQYAHHHHLPRYQSQHELYWPSSRQLYRKSVGSLIYQAKCIFTPNAAISGTMEVQYGFRHSPLTDDSIYQSRLNIAPAAVYNTYRHFHFFGEFIQRPRDERPDGPSGQTRAFDRSINGTSSLRDFITGTSSLSGINICIPLIQVSGTDFLVYSYANRRPPVHVNRRDRVHTAIVRITVSTHPPRLPTATVTRYPSAKLGFTFVERQRSRGWVLKVTYTNSCQRNVDVNPDGKSHLLQNLPTPSSDTFKYTVTDTDHPATSAELQLPYRSGPACSTMHRLLSMIPGPYPGTAPKPFRPGHRQ